MTRTIITNAAFAALALAGIAATAPAGAQPRLEQTGDGYSVVHEGAYARGNVAGGRSARIVGGGDGADVLYTGPDTAREGRAAALSGGGDDGVITYAAPASAVAAAGGNSSRG